LGDKVTYLFRTRGDASRNKEIKGFGLGLAIVSCIMEWHQGKAWVEDSSLGGACFNLQWREVENKVK
jgi:signal transduction histidine kinase